MALQYGMITIDDQVGFYYTPPDNITRCYLSSPGRKYELQALLSNSSIAKITYRELISSRIIFNLELFRYVTEQIVVDIAQHNFASERIYTPKPTHHNQLEHQKWLKFFQSTSIAQLMTN